MVGKTYLGKGQIGLFQYKRKQELFLEDKNLEKLVGDRMLLTKIVTFVSSKLLMHNHFNVRTKDHQMKMMSVPAT